MNLTYFTLKMMTMNNIFLKFFLLSLIINYLRLTIRLNFGHDVDTFKYFTMCGLQEGYEPFCV